MPLPTVVKDIATVQRQAGATIKLAITELGPSRLVRVTFARTDEHHPFSALLNRRASEELAAALLAASAEVP
jgi:phosphoglycolate phosphatase-like HAD superfamily hydrolase